MHSDDYDRLDKDRFKGARLRRARLYLESLFVKRMTEYKARAIEQRVKQPPRSHCRWRRPG